MQMGKNERTRPFWDNANAGQGSCVDKIVLVLFAIDGVLGPQMFRACILVQHESLKRYHMDQYKQMQFLQEFKGAGWKLVDNRTCPIRLLNSAQEIWVSSLLFAIFRMKINIAIWASLHF